MTLGVRVIQNRRARRDYYVCYWREFALNEQHVSLSLFSISPSHQDHGAERLLRHHRDGDAPDGDVVLVQHLHPSVDVIAVLVDIGELELEEPDVLEVNAVIVRHEAKRDRRLLLVGPFFISAASAALRPESFIGNALVYAKSTTLLSFFTRIVCCSSSRWKLGMNSKSMNICRKRWSWKSCFPSSNWPIDTTTVSTALTGAFPSPPRRGGGSTPPRNRRRRRTSAFPSRSSPETRSSATEVRGALRAAHHVLLELAARADGVRGHLGHARRRVAGGGSWNRCAGAAKITGVLPRDADVDRTSLLSGLREERKRALYRHPLGQRLKVDARDADDACALQVGVGVVEDNDFHR